MNPEVKKCGSRAKLIRKPVVQVENAAPKEKQKPVERTEEEEEEHMTFRSVLMCNNISFEFIFGDLADSKEDTVVNSTGDYIDLSVSVSKSLVKKAGSALIEACEKLVPLKSGTIAATGGFRMSCKQILHCNCHYWNGERTDPELEKILIHCIKNADDKRHSSIGFPAVGMGEKGYPPTLVIRSMLEGTTKYSQENPQSSLHRVKLYLYVKEFSVRQLQGVTRELLKYNSSICATGVINVGGTKIAVHIGDPAEAKGDIMINFMGEDNREENQPDCAISLSVLNTRKMLMTDGYGLNCCKVLHVFCPSKWKKGETDTTLLDIITRCLAQSDELGAQLITFSANHRKKFDYPPEAFAKCFQKASTKYAVKNTKTRLKKVTMIVNHDDTDTIKGFRDALGWKLTEYEPENESLSSDFLPKEKGSHDILEFSNDAIIEVEGTTIAVNLGNAAKAKADLIINFMADGQPACSLSLTSPKSSQNALQEELAELGPFFPGQIVMTDGCGLKCTKVLHIFCPSKWKEGETDMLLQGLIGSALSSGSGMGAKSFVFADIDTQKLKYPPARFASCFKDATESFFRRNARTRIERVTMIVNHDNLPIVMGFGTAHDWRLTPYPAGGKVPLGMKPGDSSSLVKLGLPTYWKRPTNKNSLFLLDKSSSEFKKISGEFVKTLIMKRDEYTILEIKRVQNPSSYLQYVLKRKSVAEKLHKSEEKIETRPMWHSTLEENVERIAKTKFDRGLSGTNGGNLLGANCCYFSTSAQYSNDWVDQFAPEGKYGEKYMFLVRVVTGEYCLGDPDYKMAPYKPNSDEQYDSAVDNLDKPTKYVVFEDTASYPEYVIKYQQFKVPDMSDSGP